MDADEDNGQEQSARAPAYGWWHQRNDQQPKAGKVSAPEGLTRKPEKARRRIATRLADRVVVARMPRDNKTLAEQRTRGAAAC